MIRRLLSGPEWAEVLTNFVALGWAWAFLRPGTFGPPGTSTHEISAAFGPVLAASWAALTGLLPAASIAVSHALGSAPALRIASTIACAMLWILAIITSIHGGIRWSPILSCALAALAALFVSQARLAADLRRPSERT
jgi:hypothetical protein